MKLRCRISGGTLRGLDFLEALWPLLPVVHDHLSIALLGESLAHLLHLLLTLLDVVDADVCNKWDASTHSSCGSGLAVFDGDTLLRLNTKLLAGVEVDSWVWLGRWWVESSGSRVDVLILEEAYRAELG